MRAASPYTTGFSSETEGGTTRTAVDHRGAVATRLEGNLILVGGTYLLPTTAPGAPGF